MDFETFSGVLFLIGLFIFSMVCEIMKHPRKYKEIRLELGIDKPKTLAKKRAKNNSLVIDCTKEAKSAQSKLLKSWKKISNYSLFSVIPFENRYEILKEIYTNWNIHGTDHILEKFPSYPKDELNRITLIEKFRMSDLIKIIGYYKNSGCDYVKLEENIIIPILDFMPYYHSMIEKDEYFYRDLWLIPYDPDSIFEKGKSVSILIENEILTVDRSKLPTTEKETHSIRDIKVI